MKDMEAVWARIQRHAGQPFRTKTGLPFTYKVPGNYLRVDRANRSSLVTSSVSPSRRYSRQRFSSGRPASTPERFSLKTLSQPLSLSSCTARSCPVLDTRP